eukprot:3632594-Amphidinium_carterae.1
MIGSPQLHSTSLSVPSGFTLPRLARSQGRLPNQARRPHSPAVLKLSTQDSLALVSDSSSRSAHQVTQAKRRTELSCLVASRE